jgi:hypothetical protein
MPTEGGTAQITNRSSSFPGCGEYKYDMMEVLKMIAAGNCPVRRDETVRTLFKIQLPFFSPPQVESYSLNESMASRRSRK